MTFFRRWVLVVTAGEVAGFAVPATVGALTTSAPALLAAGAVEGAVLGWAQATVLRRALPRFPVRRWVAATAGAAMTAYALSLLAVAVPVTLVVAGPALLLSIGTAQWLVLRPLVPRSAFWIGTTAVAWLAGLAVFLAFATPLWRPGQPVVLVVAIGVAGGLLMAAVTAAVTGLALPRLLSRTSPVAAGRPPVGSAHDAKDHPGRLGHGTRR